MAKFKKFDKLIVKCVRKGTFNGVAMDDFDTETDEWFKIAVDQDEPVKGKTTWWAKGEEIPCRQGLAKVSLRKQ